MAQRGRKPKGDRTPTSVALPTAHLERYRLEAEQRGLPLTDYIAIKLAEAHGRPEPESIAAEQERIRQRDEAEARRRERAAAEREIARRRQELPISA
jgi:hypothetical protein